MTSASAPAGSVNRNSGRLTATWTRETAIGSGLRLVISQPDAVSNIAVPTLEKMLAVQITVKAAWLKAPHRDAERSVGVAAGVNSVLTQNLR